jgi:glycosyltransferase involved in cell wall biosynthesis
MITPQRLAKFPDRKVITTFMQRIPFKRQLQKVLFPLYPLAFESLDFSDYDLVISSSARFAHGVITRPETKHICYLHSPGRMFWEPDHYFGSESRLKTLLTPALSYLRLWDHTAAQRVDQFVANSKHIAGKIKRYYGREAVVVYPFVDLEKFEIRSPKSETEDYFLVVTRLAPWKRVEIAVAAAKQAGVKLKVVGTGPDEKRLRKIAGSGVEILGGVPDEAVVELFQNCSALVMTQEEDFGITSLEAQACGKPVIAYGGGGALETVVEGKTGEFFREQTGDSLVEALKRFDPSKYRPEDCRKNAERFSKIRFQKELVEIASRAVGVE